MKQPRVLLTGESSILRATFERLLESECELVGTAVDNLCMIPANILYPLVAFLLKTVISDSCFPHQLNLNLICRVDSRMGLEETC